MTKHNDAIASSLLPEMTNVGLQASAAIAMDLADVAPGARAVATEFGLGFISLGW